MLNSIPHELLKYRNFVVWKYEARKEGKPTKVPYQTLNGQHADVTNPMHWSSFDDAIAVAYRYDGIGFVFSENDPYAGIDLDNCEGDSAASERQLQLFRQFDSYSELSPSGKGLHIIVKGTIPSGKRRNNIEIYSSRRFFTMTGNVYCNKPIAERQERLTALWSELGGEQRRDSVISMQLNFVGESDQEIIDRATNAANGAKFNALWIGDSSVIQSNDRSHSAIDQALVNVIQFYTKDPAQIERIWLLSPQGKREKTRTRKDYRERTIKKAFDMKIPRVEFAGVPPFLTNAVIGAAEAPRPLRRELPPSQPFPVDALGPLLADAVRAIVARIQCPDAIAAMSVLGAASLAVQAHADVVIPATGHAKPLSLFLVTVAASGERKSAADVEAQWAVRQFEKELRAHHDAAYPRYRNQLDAWNAHREKIKRDAKTDAAAKNIAFEALGVEPTAPLTPMMTCPEPTFEGLCRLYIDGLPTIGIFSDEGGQFVGGHGLNADNRLRTITGLSSLWDGSPLKRVRAIDGITVLPGRRLAVHLMIQPDIASVLLSDPVLKDQGFLSRILVAAPRSTAGTRFQRQTVNDDSNALANYNAQLLAILKHRPPMAQGRVNELEPRQLEFDSLAAKTWMNYADAVEHQLGSGGAFEPIRGLANKLPEHAARIAGVLTLINGLDAASISSGAFERAILIAEYFASEALRLFDAGMISPEIRLAESLLMWLLNKWDEEFVGLKVVYQLGPNAIRQAATARKAVAVLVEHGWLEPAPKGTKVAGVKVREAWAIIRQ
jgi:uncharacterized protein DUF3987